MKRRVFFTGLMGLISGMLLNAQVTIGSMEEPGIGALLELKEHAPQLSDISTADKGMLFPRVKLTNQNSLLPMFEKVVITGSGTFYEKDNVQYTKSTEDAFHIGLMVYNTTNNDYFSEGLHFWDGTSWLRLNGNVPVKPSIETLLCESKYVALNRLEVGTPYDQILKISYTGGNGGAYTATSPQDIGYGLSIERLAGTLAYGQGEVAYRVSGTPTASLPADKRVSFTLNFLGEICTATIGDDAEIKTMQFVRKSITLIKENSGLRTASEITFGNLKLRLSYRPAGSVTEACRPEFKPTFNTRILYWFRKAGSGGAFFARYGQVNPLTSTSATGDGWYSYNEGSSLSSTTNTEEYISIANRDFAEAIILLQNDDFREMYRVTYNVYNGTTDDPVTSAAATIFIEKLD